jgi:peptidyl-prolyl cis-trans isomerase B (cyclophilin B)
MKKAVIVFAFLFILAGCSVNESKQGVDNISDNIDYNNSNQEMNKEQAFESSADNQEEDNKINLENMDLINDYSQAVLKTNMGDIKVEFYNEAAPKTVNNFLKLAKDGFYDNTKFHRIIEDFMIQGGDPLSKDDDKKSRWGTGGPGYTFEDEINNKKLVKGSLAMANSGPDTNGSQFFIVTKETTPWLDGKHTNFGEVVEGMDVVENIDQVETDEGDRPVKDVVVEDVEILELVGN